MLENLIQGSKYCIVTTKVKIYKKSLTHIYLEAFKIRIMTKYVKI